MELEISPEYARELAAQKLYYKIFEAVKFGLATFYMLKGEDVPEDFYVDAQDVGNSVMRYTVSPFAVKYGAAALSVLGNDWLGVPHEWDTCQNYKGYKRKGNKVRK